MAQNDKNTKLTCNQAAPNTTSGEQKPGFLELIRTWWEDFADPEKVKADSKQILQDARNNIVFAGIAIAILILFRKILPTLIVLTGVVEMLAILFSASSMFEAVRYGRDLQEERRLAERAAGRLVRGFVFWGIILTILAGWISTGPAWVEQFPVLKELANYQLGMVNELIDFLREYLGKLF